MQLTWNDPNNNSNEVGGYHVYYWQANWDMPASVDVGDQTIYTLTGLDAGQTYHFTVTAHDGNGGRESTFSNEVVETLSASNSAPVANHSTLHTTKDRAVNSTLQASDIDGDALTYRLTTTGTKGTAMLTNAATGDYVYTPLPGVTGNDTFDFQVSDGTVDSNVATVTVTIASPENRITAGQVALYTFSEGSGTVVYDVSGVGSPLDLTVANAAAVSWPAGGGLVLNAPTMIASAGAATKVVEAVKASNELTVEAWIKPANTTQKGPARIVTLSQDLHARNVTLGQGLWGTQPSDLYDVRLRTTATSADGTPSLSTPAGTLSTGLSHVVYTRNAAGAARLYIDGVVSASGTVGGDASNWSTAYPLALGNELTGDRPWLGEFHLVALYNRALSAAEIEQNYAAGLTGSRGLTANFTAAPASGEAPLAVNFTDASTGHMTSWAWDFGDGGTSALQNPTHTYTTAGTYTVSLTVTDAEGSSTTTQTDYITVAANATNQVPVAHDGTLTTAEDTVASGTLTATDADGDVLTYHLVTSTQSTQVTLTWNDPNNDPAEVGGYRLYYWQTDRNAATSVDVGDQTSYTLTGLEPGQTYHFAVTAHDGTGERESAFSNEDSATMGSTGTGTLGTVVLTNATTGAYTYTPLPNTTGTDTFRFRAHDGLADSNLATITVTISPVNNAPTVNDDTATGSEDTVVTISVLDNDTDQDGDPLSVVAVAQGAHGVSAVNGSSVTYTPNANFYGTDTFTYTVSDGKGGTATGRVTVIITAVNDIPLAVDDATTTPEDTAVTVAVLANDIDVDGDVLSVLSATPGMHGTTVPTGTGVLYTPEANFHGVDTFTYAVQDSSGSMATGVVTVTVTPVNDAPVAEHGTLSATHGTVASGTLHATDVDEDPLTHRIVTNGSKGTAALSDAATGAYTYTPDPGATGTDTFTFRVSDGTLDSQEATITVNLPAEATDLVVLYTFEEGSGTTVYDVSGRGTPLDLTVADAAAVSWLASGGLALDAPTIMASAGAATKVVEAVKASNELTVEAWIKPANTTQKGPARIVTLSKDLHARNVTLGQGLWGTQPSDLYDVRLRTTATSVDGRPSLSTPAGTLSAALSHVVYTRNTAGAARLYIDGVEVASSTVGGDASTWSRDYRLALGNELTGDRPWLGEFHLVALYDRALIADEVWQRFIAGPDNPSSSEVVFAVNVGGPQYLDSAGILYEADTLFTGGQANTVEKTEEIAGTEEDTLYQSERFGDFSYAIPLPNGAYVVTLRFAELAWSASGQRVFNVDIEGKEIVSNLDLAHTNGSYAAYEVAIPVRIMDEELTIHFHSEVDYATVSAIVVKARDKAY